MAVVLHRIVSHNALAHDKMNIYHQTGGLIMKNYAEKQLVAKLREQYLANPPEGMSRQDIKHMSDSDLLDMDYFLHEFDDDDEVGAEGFYIF